jgi:glycosyltransferase involved in cell wall biosynthesis
MVNLVIAMPVYNEEEGIINFLEDIESNFVNISHQIIVIDDCSKDLTTKFINDYINLKANKNISLLINSQNLGHGPSTLIALHQAMLLNPEFIMSVDGDGQFKTNEMLKMYLELENNNISIIEGVRVGRNDPWYRRMISSMTKLIVFVKCGIVVKDPNTPLRIYTLEVLTKLLPRVPIKSIVPNLIFSIISRKDKHTIIYQKVQSLHRRGSQKIGSTWAGSRVNLPSFKLIRFCIKALSDLLFKSF